MSSYKAPKFKLYIAGAVSSINQLLFADMVLLKTQKWNLPLELALLYMRTCEIKKLYILNKWELMKKLLMEQNHCITCNMILCNMNN